MLFFEFNKIVLSILLTINVTKCTRIQFPDLNTEPVHIPTDNINSQSILYFKKNYNDTLISSLLRNLFNNQAVLLVSVDNFSACALTSNLANIIVITEDIQNDVLGTAAYKPVLSYFWSPLYIIVTARNQKYACDNGALSIDALNEAKSYFNKLWHTFRIARVIMSFPYTCPKHYVIYDGREVSTTGRYYNRGITLIRPENKVDLVNAIASSGKHLTQGYPLRANIFNRFPTSITECDVVDGYTKPWPSRVSELCGLDGLIMDDFLQHYKFDVNFSVDETCNLYGYVDHDNNATTGSLGCVVKHKIDISFNSRFMWNYSNESYYFLYYVTQDSLCAIIKSPLAVPLWHYAFNAVDPFLALLMLIVFSFLGFVTWVLAKISKLSIKKPQKIHIYLMNSMSSTLFGVMIKNDGRFLILKGTSLLCSIVLLALYQGHVNYQFTTNSQYNEIKNLEQLFSSQNILMTSPAVMDILRRHVNHNPAFMKRILISNISNFELIKTVLKTPGVVTVSRGNDIMIDVFRNHNVSQKGRPQIYIVNECFQNFYLSYIASSDFLFLEESTKFMMRLIEAGLPNQYYIWTRRTYHLADRFPTMGPEPRPFRPIDLGMLRIAFIFLLLGYIVSAVVFALEKCKGKSLNR